MLKKSLLLFLILFLSFTLGYKFNFYILAKVDDSCTNISSLSLEQAEKCQKDVEAELESLKGAIKPNEDRLNQLKLDINNIIQRAVQIESDLKDKAELVQKGEEKISVSKKIFEAKVREFYKRQKNYSPILVFFEKNSTVSKITQELTYQEKVTAEDKKNIISIVLYVKNVEQKKAELENENTRLSSLKSNLDSQINELENLLSGAKSYAGKLSTAIAQLSARQQEFLNQRLAGLNIPRSAGSGGSCSSDLTNGKNPGFSPAFGFFTYGVPNRVGLSQYGAKARAATQEPEDILKAYYNDITFETRDNININVQGYGSMPLEKYLLGIYEMPENWPIKALKAQAIAARSYALAYTNNGANEICTTEYCQVYHQPEKTGQWKTAVEETAGKVMAQNGQPIKAWFSSTHGGYIHSSGDIGWNSTSWTKNAIDASSPINSFADLNNNAYDKDTPEDPHSFYCDWGSRAAYDKTAWLKPEEVADIVNVIRLVRKNSANGCFVYQVDKSPPPPNPNEPGGCKETGNWSADKVKQELGSEAINSVSDISVSVDFNSGKTTNININGQDFPASEFKDWFNLRAPANIQIVGPLYNVERK